MEILIYCLVCVTIFLILEILYEVLFYRNEMVQDRLNIVKNMDDEMKNIDDMKKSFLERVLKPSYLRILKIIGNITPKSIKEKYDHLIKTSGYSQKTTVNNVLMKQIMLGLVQGGLVYLVIKYTSQEIDKNRILLAGLLGFIEPLIKLYTKSEKRKEKIKRSLPDLLDLVYVSVEAGLGFDSALKKSAEKMKGPLSEEIIKALNDISKGKDREASFREMSSRTGVEDVATFVRAVIQTEKLGSNIANMLKIQSNMMRQKRRQVAEETAAKIPVKMVFPIVILIFPSLLVVILGPAFIRILDNFSRM